MNKFYTIIMIIFFTTNMLTAKTGTYNREKLELMKIINQQQILSQRIAKAYLYVKKNKSTERATQQLKESLDSFYKTYSKINAKTKSSQIREIMKTIKQSSSDFKRLSKNSATDKNVKDILDLSDKVLKKSKMVEKLLKKSLKKEAYLWTSKSGQQQMLIERIAGYYIALQSNSKDKTTIEKKLKNTIAEFSRNHDRLMKNKRNTQSIKESLNEVDRLWKKINKLYSDKKIGTIVFQSTDKISKNMKKVGKLYSAVYK